jgi:hypothetical protein
MEIWKWLFVSTEQVTQSQEQENITVVQKALESSEYLQRRIVAKDGFYFLKGRETIIQIRG